MPLLTYFLWLLWHKGRPRGLQPTITLWPLQQDCQGENVHLQEVIRGRQAVFIRSLHGSPLLCTARDLHCASMEVFLKNPKHFPIMRI